jgi:hypothetical protein
MQTSQSTCLMIGSLTQNHGNRCSVKGFGLQSGARTGFAPSAIPFDGPPQTPILGRTPSSAAQLPQLSRCSRPSWRRLPRCYRRLSLLVKAKSNPNLPWMAARRLAGRFRVKRRPEAGRQGEETLLLPEFRIHDSEAAESVVRFVILAIACMKGLSTSALRKHDRRGRRRVVPAPGWFGGHRGDVLDGNLPAQGSRTLDVHR